MVKLNQVRRAIKLERSALKQERDCCGICMAKKKESEVGSFGSFFSPLAFEKTIKIHQKRTKNALKHLFFVVQSWRCNRLNNLAG